MMARPRPTNKSKTATNEDGIFDKSWKQLSTFLIEVIRETYEEVNPVILTELNGPSESSEPQVLEKSAHF